MTAAPDRLVSPARAAELVETRFPRLAPVRIERLGGGWDNVAYLVNGEWVMRFPLRRVAVPLLEREHVVLPQLAPRLPLAIPRPELFAPADDAEPWPMLGYRRLPGRTACGLDLDDAARAPLAAPLGAFLRALHAIPADEIAGLTGDFVGKLDLGRVVPEARRHLARAATLGVETAPLHRILDEAAVPAGRPRAVLHGDLYARHVLVDGGRPSGIIDWGDVHAGDPAVDLSLAHILLPPPAHPAFLDAYGAVDDTSWRLARLRALYHASVIFAYGHDVGDAALAREGRRSLGYLAHGSALPLR